MDFQYTIYPEKKFIKERLTGVVILADLINALKKIYSDPQWLPQYNCIVDLRRAELELRYQDIRNLIEFQKQYPRAIRGQRAFIADNDKNFGIMRMYHALSSELGFEVNIFKTKADAMDWQTRLG